MQKSIILLSLLFSLPAFAVGDVERAALTPQRVIPSAGVSSSASTLRSVSYRGGDTASGNTSVAERRAAGARNAVSRETSVARTTTAGGTSVVRQRKLDESNNRTVAVRSGNSTVSGGANTARAGTATAVTASGKTGVDWWHVVHRCLYRKICVWLMRKTLLR